MKKSPTSTAQKNAPLPLLNWCCWGKLLGELLPTREWGGGVRVSVALLVWRFRPSWQLGHRQEKTTLITLCGAKVGNEVSFSLPWLGKGGWRIWEYRHCRPWSSTGPVAARDFSVTRGNAKKTENELNEYVSIYNSIIMSYGKRNHTSYTKKYTNGYTV